MSTIAQHRGVLGASVVLFTASALTTVLWCGSMASMPGMEMPGGWTMSMAWMRMPGQSWLGAAATFIGMWSVMMVAMMMPAFVPILMRYGLRASLATLVGAGYFFVWTLCGAAVFPIGIALAEIAMRVPAVSHAAPGAAGVVVLVAGALQFTAWKSRQIACCRATPAHSLPANAGRAWRHGLRLGFRCLRCCAGPTAILLVIGVMDLRAMVLVTAAITAERLTPSGERVARVIGMVMMLGGTLLIAR